MEVKQLTEQQQRPNHGFKINKSAWPTLQVCIRRHLGDEAAVTRPCLLHQRAPSTQHCSPHYAASPQQCPCSQQVGLPLDSKGMSDSKIKSGIISRQQTTEEHLTLSLLIAIRPSDYVYSSVGGTSVLGTHLALAGAPGGLSVGTVTSS